MHIIVECMRSLCILYVSVCKNKAVNDTATHNDVASKTPTLCPTHPAHRTVRNNPRHGTGRSWSTHGRNIRQKDTGSDGYSLQKIQLYYSMPFVHIYRQTWIEQTSTYLLQYSNYCYWTSFIINPLV